MTNKTSIDHENPELECVKDCVACSSVSLRYGYGLMDASAMVELAEKWTNVPTQHVCPVQSENVSKDKPKL